MTEWLRAISMEMTTSGRDSEMEVLVQHLYEEMMCWMEFQCFLIQ